MRTPCDVQQSAVGLASDGIINPRNIRRANLIISNLKAVWLGIWPEICQRLPSQS